MTNFSDKLKKLIGLESVSGFALRANVSEGTLRNLLKGGDPKLSSALRIAKAGNTTLGWMVGEHESLKDDAGDYDIDTAFQKIPLYEVKVSAGHGIASNEYDMSNLSFPKAWFEKRNLTAANLFAVDIEGDSMEPLIPDGSVVLCDKTQLTPINDKIFVFDFDGDLLIKQIVRSDNGYIAISRNKSYPDLHIDENTQGRIIGRARRALPDIKL